MSMEIREYQHFDLKNLFLQKSSDSATSPTSLAAAVVAEKTDGLTAPLPTPAANPARDLPEIQTSEIELAKDNQGNKC